MLQGAWVGSLERRTPSKYGGRLHRREDSCFRDRRDSELAHSGPRTQRLRAFMVEGEQVHFGCGWGLVSGGLLSSPPFCFPVCWVFS